MCFGAALGKGTVSNRWGWRPLGLCDEEGSSTPLCPKRSRAQPEIQTQPLLHRGLTSPVAHTGPHTSGRHKTTHFCYDLIFDFVLTILFSHFCLLNVVINSIKCRRCGIDSMSFRTHINDSFSYVLQGAAAVAAAGVTQTICLPLLCVYEGSSNGASQVTSTSFTGLYL